MIIQEAVANHKSKRSQLNSQRQNAECEVCEPWVLQIYRTTETSTCNIKLCNEKLNERVW